jgi:REP element-mobilizing transposase RayT
VEKRIVATNVLLNVDKFRNKYRIHSHRKPNWDYSANALYFLTIVTQNRECNLGEIVVHTMILSGFGKIVEMEWHKSFEIRNELILHEFVIMPNHLHAIVEIDKCNSNNIDTKIDDEINGIGSGSGSGSDTVETHGRVSLPIASDSPIASGSPIDIELLLSIKRNPPIRLPKSISSFIAGFKSVVNTNIDNYIDEHKLSIPKYNRNNHFFQPNYHDHIVRNHFEYQNIKNYIINNPKNWNLDKFNNENA